MNPNDKTGIRESAYLFNVDLLVEGESNAIAMEKLLHALNRCGFADFRIQSGIELGRLIAQLETQGAASPAGRVPAPSADVKREEKPVTETRMKPQPAQPVSSAESLLAADGIKSLIQQNKLIRLAVNKGFGVKLSIPCRIINYDEAGQILSVYHVDEKQVYTFKLNEIDDFTV